MNRINKESTGSCIRVQQNARTTSWGFLQAHQLHTTNHAVSHKSHIQKYKAVLHMRSEQPLLNVALKSNFSGSDGLGQPLASMARQNERSGSVHHAAVRAKLNKHCYHQHLGSLVFWRGHWITYNMLGNQKMQMYDSFEWFALDRALFGLLM